MNGLIPLQLSSSSDIMARGFSSSSSSAAPPIPPRSLARKRRPGPVIDLTIFPYTQQEWIRVIEEVKRLYTTRQYKQCSTRCIQVLDNTKDPYRVHPLHSIYLSFYAASSLELIARSLHVNSSDKMPLLQQSLSYYKDAESRIECATFSADPTLVEAARQRTSSISSSIRSSVDSVFSQVSSAGSTSTLATLSPAASFCGPASDNKPTCHVTSSSTVVSQEGIAPSPLRIRKKVSFSPEHPTHVSETKSSSLPDSDLIDAFPVPPRSPSPTCTLSDHPESSISSFLLSRSLARYRSHLSALHAQLAYHTGSIQAQIHALQTCRKARRSNLPNLFTTDFGIGGMDGVDKEEMRKVELKARIERLKTVGWRRERFCEKRYQVLAEKALGELE